MGGLLGLVLPGWARWVAIAAALFSVWLLGDLHGTRVTGEKHNEYVMAQAKAGAKIVVLQGKNVVTVETEYHDRIQKIYIKGEKIENSVKDLVQSADDAHFGVNVGFVRVLDAAWAGEPAGPATDADRGPSSIPLSAIGEVEAHNATSCLAWREQALGWREFYAGQQQAVNGVKPSWYRPIQGESLQDQALPSAPKAPLTGEVK